MLSEFGEFYPYGGYMKPSGEISNVGAKDEEDDHPKSKDLLYVLRDSFSQMASTGSCKAMRSCSTFALLHQAQQRKATLYKYASNTPTAIQQRSSSHTVSTRTAE